MTPIVSLGRGVVLPKARWKPKPAKPGEDHPRAVLTNEQVRRIWRLRCQVSQGVLAKREGTTQSTISRIWHRKAWTTVTDGVEVGFA